MTQIINYDENGVPLTNITGGGGASELDDLTDVIITTVAQDDLLIFNGTDWVNQAITDLTVVTAALDDELLAADTSDSGHLKSVTPSSIANLAHLTATTQVWVSKAGSDSNSGLNINKPKLTIGSAIIAAAALGATGVTINLDAGDYTENITLVANTILLGPGATLIGTISVASDCYIILNEQYSNGNSGVMLDKTGSTGNTYVVINKSDGTGADGSNTGNGNFRNATNGGKLYLRCSSINVSGWAIADSASAYGNIHCVIGDILLSKAYATGLYLRTSGSNLIGHIGRIVENGSQTDTVGILVNNAGCTIKANISEILTDVAYNLASPTAGFGLFLTCPKVTGTRTGTPAIEISSALVKSASVQATGMSSAGFVKNDASGNLSGGNSIAADDLSDVTITSAAQDDLIIHNGTAFVNQSVMDLTSVSAASGDQILIADASDSNHVKRVSASTIAGLASGGASVSAAMLSHEETNGTGPGFSTSANSWVTRTINTEVADPSGITSLPGSNTFRLQAGTYIITIDGSLGCPSGDMVLQQRLRLYNTTDSAVVFQGINTYNRSQSGYNIEVIFSSTFSGLVTIAGQKDFRVEHYADQSRSAGQAISSGENEVYLIVTIMKIA